MSKRTRQNLLLKDVIPMSRDPEYDWLQIEKARIKASATIARRKSIKNAVATKKSWNQDNLVKEKTFIDPIQILAKNSAGDSVLAPAILFIVKKSVIFDKTALLNSESILSSSIKFHDCNVF